MAEIEQLWCFPITKRNRNNNPNYNSVQTQEGKLEKETKEPKKKRFWELMIHKEYINIRLQKYHWKSHWVCFQSFEESFYKDCILGGFFR